MNISEVSRNTQRVVYDATANIQHSLQDCQCLNGSEIHSHGTVQHKFTKDILGIEVIQAQVEPNFKAQWKV